MTLAFRLERYFGWWRSASEVVELSRSMFLTAASLATYVHTASWLILANTVAPARGSLGLLQSGEVLWP